MEQVDFYILGEHSRRNIIQMVCQLCEKAISQSMNVVINARSNQQAQDLDELLWTYKADSFIAHINPTTTPHTTNQFQYPVYIYTAENGFQDTIPAYYNQLLINLSSESPSFMTHFNRLAEMVDNNEHEKEVARSRYRNYRQQGYTLNKFDL